jgi:DNA (cytosine-5)-methyltransferase 1
VRVLDLFSGIGGFSLGLERAGFKTVAFCEIEPYCRRVLAKHWPGVPIYGDIRELTAARLAADGIGVDVICGGFPCQDISLAGKGAGIEGERSGLWSEYSRLIGELRPRYAIVENVAALLGRGLDKVLGDLAALGFDAEWHCIPASAVGAPHRRDRLWVVAYPHGHGESNGAIHAEMARGMADADHPRLEGWLRTGLQECAGEWFAGEGDTSVRHAQRSGRSGDAWGRAGAQPADGHWWFSEPDVGRVAHGVPARVDRLRALGNAVVPQIPELIGRAILAGAS